MVWYDDMVWWHDVVIWYDNGWEKHENGGVFSKFPQPDGMEPVMLSESKAYGLDAMTNIGQLLCILPFWVENTGWETNHVNNTNM